MHDIRVLRDDPAAFDRGWESRGLGAQTPAILAADERLRAIQTGLQTLQSTRNELSRQIGQAKAAGREVEAGELMARVDAQKSLISRNTQEEAERRRELQTLLAALPNLPAPVVPEGLDEHGNVEVCRWGEPRDIESPKDHVDLGQGLGMMDFEAAARMSGARFVVLSGALARLQRALGQFMLDLQTREHGYTEISPPLLVRDEAMFGAGQLPKFAEDSFRTSEGLWLIPTAEVSLANLVRDQITPTDRLPLRLTALTPCFRSEAGAAGKDTRGMIRQHQFEKVELVSITTPEDAEAEHERMTACAEAVLERLELPYRTVLLCAGDMGFQARKTYDLEVWLPSQKTWREISSCSDCGDFQARRMDARFKGPKDKAARFVHTLNGSGLAVGRTLVAIMENYQEEAGRIAIPPALHPYMRGMTHIGAEA